MPLNENAEWRATVAAYACLVSALADNDALDLKRLVRYLSVAEMALRERGEVSAAELVAWMGGQLARSDPPH